MKKSFTISLVLLMAWFSLGPAPAVIQEATQKLGHCRQKLCYCQSPHQKTDETRKKMFCHLSQSHEHETPVILSRGHKTQLNSSHATHRKLAVESGDTSYLLDITSIDLQKKVNSEILRLKNLTAYSFLFDLSLEKPPQNPAPFFSF